MDSTVLPISAAPILPGAIIGCLGGGQLGRMMGFAARSMGYDVKALDPDPACAMKDVASRLITAPFDDVEAALELARNCDVVTLEIEQISADVLEAVSAVVPMRPGREPVFTIQDRLRQKRWLETNRFPLGAFAAANSVNDVVGAARAFGACIVKSARGGYDGRGQVRLSAGDDASDAWDIIGARECVVEQTIDIDFEISVLVARSPGGETVVYAPSRNHHTSGILTWAVVPAMVSEQTSLKAQQIARDIAEKLGIVGLLAVECFVTTAGELLVNELAPRPHNTFHHSERAHATSQFEQLVRAVCNLPLGSADVISPAAIMNVLGDAWLEGMMRLPDFTSALGVVGSRLHLYGKSDARPGRKMGHLSAVGATSQEAVDRVLESYRLLSPATVDMFDVQGPVLPNIHS